ncbi:MAG TPA: hypothetical protein DFS52_22295, partial [Myxococcales bacterium]|nr:hypothetical protein [Myxococcales bacterium]
MHRLLAIAFLAGLLTLSSKLDAAPDSSASPSKAKPASSSDEPDEEARADWEKTKKLAMDVRAYGEISGGLRKRFLAGDKDGLRAFIADPKNLRLHKALAGSYLAQLGEIEGLGQLSDLSRFAPQHRAMVRDELRNLTRTTEGEVRERAEALLDRTAPQPSFKPNLTALNALHSNQPAPAPPMPGFALRRLFEYGLPQGVERWSAVAFSPDGAELVACADRAVR